MYKVILSADAHFICLHINMIICDFNDMLRNAESLFLLNGAGIILKYHFVWTSNTS